MCCLNQFTIGARDEELAGRLIEIFFTFFKVHTAAKFNSNVLFTLKLSNLVAHADNNAPSINISGLKID